MQSALIIKDMDDYDYILREQFGFVCADGACCKTYTIPEEIGRGTIRNIFPCGNAGLSIIHIKLKHPLIMNYDGYDSAFETTCCFRGHIAYCETGIIDTCLSPNELGIYTKQKSRGMMMYPSDEEILAVSLFGTGEFKKLLPFCREETKEKTKTETKETDGLVHWLMRPKKVEIPLKNLFRLILDTSIDAAVQPLFYEGIVKTLLTLLYRRYILNPSRGIVGAAMPSPDYAAVLCAHDILSERYTDPPTIPELARLVFLNENRLKRGFKELFGKTIHQFTNTLKMETAQSLLEDKNKTVSQIAYEVGYVNVSHFSHAFRQIHGKNPSDFRKP